MSDAHSASALWITGISQSEIRQEALPAPLQNEVRIKTLYTGISRGTESLVYSGGVPASEHQRMRAPFQEGEFTFPVKYGYVNVGEVQLGPESLQGRRVFSLYPHQTHFNIAADAVTVLPEGVLPERAVLTANMETAINALWDAQPAIGDNISVVGAGLVGCLVAYLASRIAGCTVQLIDINDQRATIADSLGVNFAQPSEAQGDQDLVIHSSATEQGLNTALELAGFEATILELSWFGNRNPSISLGGAFHSRRLQIKSSQVGSIATSQRVRWNYQRRLQLALSQLTDPALDVLISGESPFSQLPETLARIAGKSTPATDSRKNGAHVASQTSIREQTLCHRITYA